MLVSMVATMMANSPPPLYPKLHPGRHTIPSGKIEEIQRERLRGAVIHAVTTGGYQGASASELSRLAGVSKRTLYERFGSKQGCLQAAYDAILENLVTAMAQARGTARDPRARLRAIIAAFQTAVVRERRGSALALLITAEAAESDLAGPMRLVDHLGAQLGPCYEGGHGPPDFVIRGAATAVMSVTRSWIFHGREDELGEVARQLSDWVHRYRGQATQLLELGRSELLMEVARVGESLGAEATGAVDPPQTLQQCCAQALSLMADAEASDRDWAVGLCLSYFELLHHVRSDPDAARLVFVDAPGLDPEADKVREQMIQGGANLYSERAPAALTPSAVVAHAVVGASWGLLHDHLEARDGDLRTTVLCEQMSYLAIAPVLGCEQAVTSILTARVSAPRPLRSQSRPAEDRRRGVCRCMVMGSATPAMTPRDGWHRLRFLLLHSPNYLFILPGAVMSAFGGVISLTVLSILGPRWTDA